jgi:hypothetical protein
MKAPMESAMESALTLEAVAEHFEQWRRNKKKGERIPERLWSEAVDLVEGCGVSQVSRTLRLSGAELNKRRGIVGTGQRRRGQDRKAAFVEIEPAVVQRAVGPTPSAAPWMELERPDGFRLRIRPCDGADMLALLDRFLGGSTCCS